MYTNINGIILKKVELTNYTKEKKTRKCMPDRNKAEDIYHLY